VLSSYSKGELEVFEWVDISYWVQSFMLAYLFLGFAFVYFEDERDGDDAIRSLDGVPFGPGRRRLSVEWSRVISYSLYSKILDILTFSNFPKILAILTSQFIFLSSQSLSLSLSSFFLCTHLFHLSEFPCLELE
jgi:hypothetical protein